MLTAVLLALMLVGVFVAAPSVRFLAGVIVFTRKWSQQAEQARNHLFFETDYQELLTACRALSKRAAAGELRSGQYCVHLGKRDPETLTFPQVILDLKPACVYTNWHGDGEVVIELFPGPEWLGVTAFPEGSAGHGSVKLIEGLWYFDPKYSSEYPKYVDKINAMIEEGRRRKETRSSAPTPQPQGGLCPPLSGIRAKIGGHSPPYELPLACFTSSSSWIRISAGPRIGKCIT